MSNVDPYTALVAHVERIKEVMKRAEDARKLPNRYKSEAGLIRLTAEGFSGFSRIEKDVGERARAALGAFVDAEQKRGEQERDEQLAACAAELDALRASLQSLVGPAIVALGERARGMRV